MTDDGEALRRRLYEPGAGTDDVAAYLRVAQAEPSEQEPPAPPHHPARVRRGVWIVAAVAVLVAAAGLLTHLPIVAAPDAGPSPLPTRAVAASTGTAFVAALSRGDDAGLGPWWEAGAPYLEAHGTGEGTVELPVSASARGGRLTVLLVAAEDRALGWSAARLVIHDDRTIHLQQQADATGAVRAGVPAIGRFVYSAEHRPMRLFIHAPDGVRWGVAAIFEG